MTTTPTDDADAMPERELGRNDFAYISGEIQTLYPDFVEPNEWLGFWSAVYERMRRPIPDLAQPSAGADEPVAWQFQDSGGEWKGFTNDPGLRARWAEQGFNCRPVYTRPATQLPAGDDAAEALEWVETRIRVFEHTQDVSEMSRDAIRILKTIRRALRPAAHDADVSSELVNLSDNGNSFSNLRNNLHDVERQGDGHDSDCSTHNEPAYFNGPCDCGQGKKSVPLVDWDDVRALARVVMAMKPWVVEGAWIDGELSEHAAIIERARILAEDRA